MTGTKTKFDNFIEDATRRRIYEQESVAFEAAELIATLMQEQNVKKAELARRIGKSKAFVTQVLSGARNMTLHTFADLVFALGHRVEFKVASHVESAPEVSVQRCQVTGLNSSPYSPWKSPRPLWPEEIRPYCAAPEFLNCDTAHAA